MADRWDAMQRPGKRTIRTVEHMELA